jgi:hypothetical protein
VLWSEGPRATLLFRAIRPGSGPLLLRLQLGGVASHENSRRAISVHIGNDTIKDISLQDGEPAEFSMVIPPGAMPDDAIRIAIDIDHPVDPRQRGIRAPVNRAGVKLFSLQVEMAEQP